jgi:8-oxo-dGTP diphosphatase
MSVDTPEPQPSRSHLLSYRDVDWSCWEPTDRATLLFVLDGDQILLIRKKRGLGAGKINGPGGRIEPGESPKDCALRELHEEVGLRALSPVKWGEHHFQFTDGYSLHVHVFASTDFTGVPIETDEAIPMWFSCSELPYDEMWEDDRLWLPHMLAGRRFTGWYLFDGDSMVDYRLDVEGQGDDEQAADGLNP